MRAKSQILRMKSRSHITKDTNFLLKLLYQFFLPVRMPKGVLFTQKYSCIRGFHTRKMSKLGPAWFLRYLRTDRYSELPPPPHTGLTTSGQGVLCNGTSSKHGMCCAENNDHICIMCPYIEEKVSPCRH